MSTKICSRCKKIKEFSEFGKSRFIKCGRNSWCKQCFKEYQFQNKEHISNQSKNRYYGNLIERRRSNKERSNNIRKRCLEKYGNKCACCGEDYVEFLAVDHTNNDGSKERRTGLKGTKLFKFLCDNPISERYRILCHNCNMSFGLYGYCPHQK